MGLTLRVLEALAASPFQQGASEIARALGISKWRLHRHIHTLRELGYVIQDTETGKFEPGTAFYTLTKAIPPRFRFMEFARPAMVALHKEIGHTVVAAVLVNDKMVLLDSVPSAEEGGLDIARGKPHDLHASAHGKTALAFGPPPLLEEIVRAPLRRYSAQTITDPARLRRVIAQVRIRGWASAFEEGPRSGINTVAAPLIGPDQVFVGSIGFIVPGRARAVRPRVHEIEIRALMATAERISRGLR
ncbi:MAG: IclR family transcriptional regulator [Lautropia sp.]